MFSWSIIDDSGSLIDTSWSALDDFRSIIGVHLMTLGA
jgi:hypothetical protein